MINLLKKLLVISNNDLLITLQLIKDKDYTVVSDKENYVVFIPKQYNKIGIVSHIDTVYNKIPHIEENVYTIWNINPNSVLGGDDRCGVAIALKTYLYYKNIDMKPMFLFFNYEETGSLGVEQFLLDFATKIPELLETKYFIGLDRQGYNDYVVYNTLDYKSKEILTNYCNRFGFYERVGSTSDVRVLSDILSIPSFNISVGFYKQHTTMEYIDKIAFITAYKKLLHMLKEPITEKLNLEFNDFDYNFDDTFKSWDYIPTDYWFDSSNKKKVNSKKPYNYYFKNRWF